MRDFIHVLPNKNSNIWLDFVGKSYYSPKDFIREAKIMGFSRLVDTYGKIGDLVLFAQKNGKNHTIFAVGIVEGYCLPWELIKEIRDENQDLVKIGETNYAYEVRGCGMLVTSGTYEVAEGREDEFAEAVNRKIYKNRKEAKKLPKVFMRGRIIKVFTKPIKLIADYSRMPYRVEIVKAPLNLRSLFEKVKRVQNLIHISRLYEKKEAKRGKK